MSDLYFVAIIPPDPIRESVENIKHDLSCRFGPTHALKSPPHITLVPPRKLQACELVLVNKHLETLIKAEKSFELSAFRFSAFPPRVIFIDFKKSNQLETFHKRLMNMLDEESLHQFSPHMTIAFRDMKPSVFHEAWKEYKCKEINFKFIVDRLFVLKHDGKKWQIHTEFSFEG